MMSDTRARAKPDQAEHGLSHWVDVFLDRALLGECWYTAVETGSWMVGKSAGARMNAEARRRARGIKPSHLDWYAWQKSTGVYVQWELKVHGRPTRLGQDQTMAALRRNKISTAVCETVPQVWEFLSRAGFALHANAANIATELHERYLANRREHATEAAPRKKRSPRKASTRTPTTVKQAHKLGLWR